MPQLNPEGRGSLQCEICGKVLTQENFNAVRDIEQHDGPDPRIIYRRPAGVWHHYCNNHAQSRTVSTERAFRGAMR